MRNDFNESRIFFFTSNTKTSSQNMSSVSSWMPNFQSTEAPNTFFCIPVKFPSFWGILGDEEERRNVRKKTEIWSHIYQHSRAVMMESKARVLNVLSGLHLWLHSEQACMSVTFQRRTRNKGGGGEAQEWSLTPEMLFLEWNKSRITRFMPSRTQHTRGELVSAFSRN